MANFDFKTATPDTSFPANGFLFEADSQSVATPSIYSHTAYLNYILSLANTWIATQTFTPAANSSALVVTGASLTGSDASTFVNMAGTWNTSGTPTAIKLNVTDTASNASSLLMDLQVGGAARRPGLPWRSWPGSRMPCPRHRLTRRRRSPPPATGTPRHMPDLFWHIPWWAYVWAAVIVAFVMWWSAFPRE